MKVSKSNVISSHFQQSDFCKFYKRNFGAFVNRMLSYVFIIIWVFSCFLRTDGGFAFAPWHAKKSEQKKNSAEKWSEKICQSMLRDESLRECEKLFITHGQLVSQWQNSLHLVFKFSDWLLTIEKWRNMDWCCNSNLLCL